MPFRYGALALTALLAGCVDNDPVATTTPEQMTRGSDLYNYYCRHCHKLRGPGELLEHRDPSRPALRHHELMLLMQFGDAERHRNMPTFMEANPHQLEKIADYVVQLQTASEDTADGKQDKGTETTAGAG